MDDKIRWYNGKHRFLKGEERPRHNLWNHLSQTHNPNLFNYPLHIAYGTENKD